MKQNSKKKPQKKARPGCIFWIALILLALTIFIFSHKRIGAILDETGFLTLFDKKSDTFSAPEIKRVTGKEDTGDIAIPDKSQAGEIEIIAVKKEDTEEVLQKEDESTEAVIASKPAPPETFKVRDSFLYFIVINDNGTTMLKKTERAIRFTDSPLTSTINSLLGGVSSSEINKNYISLIPEKTRLNRLWIKEGVAYMDFSDNFQFNSFGREGYLGQLKQIVYTATEFPTVKSVQILIDGEIKSSMGSEGIFIGKPVSRESFN